MKVLFVGVNAEICASMFADFLRALVCAAEVDFYGPGYSTNDELERGLTEYWKQKKYDLVLINSVIYRYSIRYWNNDIDIEDAFFLHRVCLTNFSIYEAFQYADNIVEEVLNLKTIRVLQYADDTVAIPEKMEEFLKDMFEAGVYLLGEGAELLREVPDKEYYGIHPMTNKYRDLVKKNSSQVISMMPFSLTYFDLAWQPICKREFDYTIPGSISKLEYHTRYSIQCKLRQRKLKEYTSFSDREMKFKRGPNRTEQAYYQNDTEKYIASMVKSSYIVSPFKRSEITKWREEFNIALSSSKIAYADGGEGEVMVRKYAEIPARATVLIARDVVGLQNVGFVDGENMILVTEDNVVEKCEELLENPIEMQKIALEGQKLVIQKHMANKCVENFLMAITAIKRNDYHGAYWEKGRFVIMEN